MGKKQMKNLLPKTPIYNGNHFSIPEFMGPYGENYLNYRWSNKLAIKRVISDAAKDQEFFSLCKTNIALSVHRLVRGWGQLSAALPELLGIQCLF